MTLEEKKLYHQIHPVKLFTDIVSAFGAVYLLWLHDNLFIAVCVAFIPSTIVSMILIAKTNLEKYKDSAFGPISEAHGVEIVRSDSLRRFCRYAHGRLDQYAVAGRCGVYDNSFHLDERINLQKTRFQEGTLRIYRQSRTGFAEK